MSKRPPTYKAAIKFIQLYRLLKEQELSQKELMHKLKISEPTLKRYLGAIKESDVVIINTFRTRRGKISYNIPHNI